VRDAHHQISNLIHRYSEAVDAGRFEVLDELFAHAIVRIVLGENEPGPGTTGNRTSAMYRESIILYEDGTPRTRHLVTNTVIDVDEEAGRATARSYNTTLQQPPGQPVTIIATAQYHDAFERVDGTWRFTERLIRQSSMDGVKRDFIGDMSAHLHNPPPT
jgi:3-phenylpropionate/cinnamic acid dioxygenase small subunit